MVDRRGTVAGAPVAEPQSVRECLWPVSYTHLQRLCDRGAGEEGYELFAALAVDAVARPAAFGEYPGKLSEHRVSDGVASLAIERVEVVCVVEDYGAVQMCIRDRFVSVLSWFMRGFHPLPLQWVHQRTVVQKARSQPRHSPCDLVVTDDARSCPLEGQLRPAAGLAGAPGRSLKSDRR